MSKFHKEKAISTGMDDLAGATYAVSGLNIHGCIPIKVSTNACVSYRFNTQHGELCDNCDFTNVPVLKCLHFKSA